MSEAPPHLDLRPDHWAIVRDILQQRVPERTVLAFGSRATWTAKEYSDLDLAILGDEPSSGDATSTLAEDFSESDLPFRVDIVDWARIDETFRDIIRREGIALQSPANVRAEPASIRRLPSTGENLNVASGWTQFRLRDICSKIGSGATPRGGKEVYLTQGPFALIRSQNVYNDGFRDDGLAFIEGKHAAKLAGVEVLARDVLLNITGDSVARTCQVDSRVLPARVNQHVAIVRPDSDQLDPTFLRYLLVAPDMQARMHLLAGAGATRNALTKAMIEDFEVLAPNEITEQRAIAHILGTLDDKIELNRRMNETLEAMARTLFKSWFVDFDPIRAKMEGRDTGLPQHLANFFPDRLMDSELGEIPEGWTIESIYNFADVVYGAPFASKQFNTENLGVPLIRIRDLATHEPGVSTQQAHNKGHLIEPGDIVVGMDGEFRLHVWKGPNAWLNQRVCHFEPKAGVPTAFLVEALRRPLAFFERGKVGTTVIHLGKSDIDTFRIIQPGDLLLGVFGDIAQPLLDQSVVNALDSRTVAQTRNLQLPKLISGEIRIPNCAKMEEATA